MEHCEVIRRAYYVDQKSVRQIARELDCSRKTVNKALTSATPTVYTRTAPYVSPKIDPFKPRIYSHVIFETNRYSVPVDLGGTPLTVRAYPFQIEILDRDQVLARHPRSYDREQDLFDPLHYLPLLVQRPGAFEHAIPMRRWRETWPDCYTLLLERLRHRDGDGPGLRMFIAVLQLHQHYPASLIVQAITEALALGVLHVDGIRLCLHQFQEPPVPPPSLGIWLTSRISPRLAPNRSVSRATTNYSPEATDVPPHTP